MPLSTIIPAIIGSIVGNIVDAAPTPPAWPVAGPVRAFPDAAKRGAMAPPDLGAVQIDGQFMPLSPAAQFRNELNMIMVPSAIEQPVTVRYLTDASGAVWRIWILTPAELAASR